MAKYINEFKAYTGIPSSELCFVGNGDNDEWAHLSGCKTICINPENTNANNIWKWHSSKIGVKNLNEILPEILCKGNNKTNISDRSL